MRIRRSPSVSHLGTALGHSVTVQREMYRGEHDAMKVLYNEMWVTISLIKGVAERPGVSTVIFGG